MTITTAQREQMHLVIVGHVDHGKSTVIGRLLADTGSLPEGKLEQVRAMCDRNARPFEYAFLLDALKSEQAQGITIDTARCFFKTAKRDYIINDAPGHIEFLKNMVTGAARAEAALLVIDAKEGIQENSKRHGYMVSMVGIKQVVILVNKLDLVDYSREVFESIRDQYTLFLKKLDITPLRFIPISAREGVNITRPDERLSWHDGPTVLEQLDDFAREPSRATGLFRFPVQDVYKFTEHGDDRRILAGTVESGAIKVGDEVEFLPSGKHSAIKSIEFLTARPDAGVSAGQATGFTLTTQVYVNPGELMYKAGEAAPLVSRRFRANLFWMGRAAMIMNKVYKLKLGASRVAVELAEILNVLDASELTSVRGKNHVARHDVAECVLETTRPLAFDLQNEVESTGRFVIVDDYEIAGCGVILATLSDEKSLFKERIQNRELQWEKGFVTAGDRAGRYHHRGKFVVLAGPRDVGKRELAKQLELKLFSRFCHTYYLGIGNVFEDLDAEDQARTVRRDQHIRQLGELARIMTGSGAIFITTLTGVDDYDLERLKLLNEPNEIFVVSIGENPFSRFPVDVSLSPHPDRGVALDTIQEELNKKNVLLEYYI